MTENRWEFWNIFKSNSLNAMCWSILTWWVLSSSFSCVFSYFALALNIHLFSGVCRIILNENYVYNVIDWRCISISTVKSIDGSLFSVSLYFSFLKVRDETWNRIFSLTDFMMLLFLSPGWRFEQREKISIDLSAFHLNQLILIMNYFSNFSRRSHFALTSVWLIRI